LTAGRGGGIIDKHRERTTHRTAGKCEILAEKQAGISPNLINVKHFEKFKDLKKVKKVVDIIQTL
jgi:hypothetical protein